jgi:hypothetical protein
MDFLGHFLLAIFIGLVVFAALTFGFMLLVWFAAFAVTISLLIMLRSWIRRWLFLYWSRDRTPPQPPVIDAEYRDISDKK